MFDDENVKSRFEKKKQKALFGHFVFHDVRKKPNENTQDDTNARQRTTRRANTNSTLKRREREKERDHERGRRRRKKRVNAETFTFRRIRSVVLKSITLDDCVPFGVQSDESFPSREGNDFHQHRVEEDNKEDEEEKNERRR